MEVNRKEVEKQVLTGLNTGDPEAKWLLGILVDAGFEFSNPELKSVIAEYSDADPSDVVNLTQHPASQEQILAGVYDLSNKAALQRLLTFDNLPSREEIEVAAAGLAELTWGFGSAMIGGAPYLMAPLERALRRVGVRPLYAFSVRESTEETQPDGSIKKVNVFRHAGFVDGS